MIIIIIIIIIVLMIIIISIIIVIVISSSSSTTTTICIWELLLGIRLLGTLFRRGSSNHQAVTAQMLSVETNIVECRPPLGALPLSPTPGSRTDGPRAATAREAAWSAQRNSCYY